MNELNIISYNATSVVKLSTRAEIESQAKKMNAKILLLQETRLKGKHKLKFDGMKVYRSDEGVGTCVAVSKEIESERVNLTSLKHINHTAAWIKVKAGNVLIASLYVPCRVKMEDLREDLKNLEEEMEQFQDAILGGDLNARHKQWNVSSDDNENTNGKVLQQWLEGNHVKLLSTKENTYRDISKLDHFLVSRVITGYNLMRLDTSTEHTPILLKWRVERYKFRPKIRKFRTFKGVDWDEVRRKMTGELANVRYDTEVTWTIEEIDCRISELTEITNKTQDEAARWIRMKEHESVPLSDEVLALMNRRQAVKEKQKEKR